MSGVARVVIYDIKIASKASLPSHLNYIMEKYDVTHTVMYAIQVHSQNEILLLMLTHQKCVATKPMVYQLRSNKWKKRGLAIIPNRYGVAFGVAFLNQGGALLHVYTDGSVFLSHGGMEMGQGLHTKMIQVCG